MQTPFSTPPARTVVSTPDAPRIDRVRVPERVYMECRETDLPMYESLRHVLGEDNANGDNKGKSKRKGAELKNPWLLMKKCRKLFSGDGKSRTSRDSCGAREKMEDLRETDRLDSGGRLQLNEANRMWLGNMPF